MHLSINKGRWVKTDSYACKNNDTTLIHFLPFPNTPPTLFLCLLHHHNSSITHTHKTTLSSFSNRSTNSIASINGKSLPRKNGTRIREGKTRKEKSKTIVLQMKCKNNIVAKVIENIIPLFSPHDCFVFRKKQVFYPSWASTFYNPCFLFLLFSGFLFFS